MLVPYHYYDTVPYHHTMPYLPGTALPTSFSLSGFYRRNERTLLFDLKQRMANTKQDSAVEDSGRQHGLTFW